jgi:hypothetical protein
MFAARVAYRLAYRSQRGTALDRSHDRQRRLYRRLGTEYEHFEQAPPPRPKGMHRRTYERLTAELYEVAVRQQNIFNACMEAQGFVSTDEQAAAPVPSADAGSCGWQHPCPGASAPRAVPPQAVESEACRSYRSVLEEREKYGTAAPAGELLDEVASRCRGGSVKHITTPIQLPDNH